MKVGFLRQLPIAPKMVMPCLTAGIVITKALDFFCHVRCYVYHVLNELSSI